jgi:hypothetical protein
MSKRTAKISRYSTSHSSVLQHVFRHSRTVSTTLAATKQGEHLALQAEKRRNAIQGKAHYSWVIFQGFDTSTALSQVDREAVQRMDIDNGHSFDDVEAVAHTVPPGDEAFDMSHEGGEFEVFEDIAAGLAQSIG